MIFRDPCFGLKVGKTRVETAILKSVMSGLVGQVQSFMDAGEGQLGDR